MVWDKINEFSDISEAIKFAETCSSLRVWCSLKEKTYESLKKFLVTSVDDFTDEFLKKPRPANEKLFEVVIPKLPRKLFFIIDFPRAFFTDDNIILKTQLIINRFIHILNLDHGMAISFEDVTIREDSDLLFKYVLVIFKDISFENVVEFKGLIDMFCDLYTDLSWKSSGGIITQLINTSSFENKNVCLPILTYALKTKCENNYFENNKNCSIHKMLLGFNKTSYMPSPMETRFRRELLHVSNFDENEEAMIEYLKTAIVSANRFQNKTTLISQENGTGIMEIKKGFFEGKHVEALSLKTVCKNFQNICL